MLKQFLRTAGLLSFTATILAAAPQAFAQGQITGQVYQITPNDVYVEMPDHTAVRVPNDAATFMMNGVPVDVTSLQRGNAVMVQYLPKYKTTQTTTTYKLDGLPPMPTERSTVTRDTNENGHVVHHVWYDGRWHTQE